MVSINSHLITTSQTVKQWLSQWELNSDFTSRKFLDLKLLSGSVGVNITNLDRIKNKYNADELSELNSKTPDNVIIKAGTEVGLPNNIIQRRFAKVVPDTIQLTEFEPFIAARLKELLSDPNYKSDIRDNSGQKNGTTDVNDISVYIWVRSLTQAGDNSQEGTWLNISDFVESVTTNVTKAVGSFSLTLSPAIARYNYGIEGWHLDSLKDNYSSSIISKYKTKEDNFLSREDHFFNRVLQENDLVYIRFEKLSIEQERNLPKTDHATFWGNYVVGNIYDMIGLIDNVSINESEANITTLVQGRDLMKVLIEDGSYFFPEQFAQNIFTKDDSILTKRNRIELFSGILTASGASFKPIFTVLKYIFNKFSNMGLIPNSVFSDYGDRANKIKYELQTSALSFDGKSVIELINNEFKKEERQGIWRILELVFDPNAAKRVMADNSIATDNGSIINSIRKLCQEPFVEFYGDTYGDKYNFIVRRPPFDEKGYKGMVYGSAISEDTSDGVNVTSKQITNLFTKGELINDPIVQRAPTFDQFKEKTDRQTKQRKQLNGRPATLSSLVIDIDEADVINDNLTYHDEVYSWYRLIPRGLGVHDDNGLFLLSPVIPLDEYAKIWGNKQYTIEYNYSPAEFIDDSVLQKSQKYVESQTFLDLQYIIQSHVYLPFTRHGVIRINGNRTIKRGTFIYYKPTDEVFYVDAVTQVRALNDRITQLQVSRGMREKYIKGVEISFGSKKELVSYFKIVNTDIVNDASISNTDFLKNWTENLNIFNFFLQRRQWIDENNIG